MILLLATGLVLGFLIITQARYFTGYVSSEGRDSSENIFRKIQILKTSNDELEDTIASLEAQLEDLSNQALALESIENEINKNSIISGVVDVWGPGIKLEIETQINEIWFTDIANEPGATPMTYDLMQNYPNPFNPSTTIEYALAKNTKTEIVVYDLLGNKVATLVDGYQNIGTHKVAWDASGVSAGVYIYQIKTEDFIQSKKMILVK